ncbi:hypothetical protein GCM10009117_05610 [Gangjinia marincola]|uniref:Uncharacterized protein n=1 Tax=Gangjinia marincola TaxID=578463 RepID=A0ABP3XQ37_9FLAO
MSRSRLGVIYLKKEENLVFLKNRFFSRWSIFFSVSLYPLLSRKKKRIIPPNARMNNKISLTNSFMCDHLVVNVLNVSIYITVSF